MRRLVGGVSLALLFAVLPGGVSAHPDHAEDDGVLSPLHAAHQHGQNDGHLPAVQRNVELVGALDLFADAEQPGRVADVAVFGRHAYLGAFSEPECRHDSGGVYVVDVSDPANPTEAGFIPATPYAYVGEGLQVLDLDTPSFTGQVLLHNNENCSPVPGGLPAGRGGASLWDVTDPTDPRPLAQHVGDTDPATTAGIPHLSSPHQSHSVFGWQQGERAYLVMVDNAELGNVGDAGFDIDIFDITDPANPTLAVETGLPDFPQILEDPSPNGSNAFLHDMVVKQVGERFLLLGSYWDGGYILLDVTDLPATPTFLRDTDFGPVEPLAAEMGLPADWSPEGNAHQAEFNFDDTLFLGADEDFNAHRITGVIAGGRYTGDRFSATQGSDTPPITPETPMSGPTNYVGEACAPLLPSTQDGEIALSVRGTCTFTVKVQNAERAGYDGIIVFGDQAGCEAQVNMLAVGSIPSMFVARSVGLKLLDLAFTDPCATENPAAATGQPVEIAAVFDGWGYLHLYDAQTMQALDHWALPESLDPSLAIGSGDLSVHEVAMDPTRNRAYVSHYAGGFRVFDFSREGGIVEVGAYIAEGGNNLWGVEVLPVAGADEPLVLASDRDSGLYVFRYAPPSEPTRGNRPDTPPGLDRRPPHAGNP